MSAGCPSAHAAQGLDALDFVEFPLFRPAFKGLQEQMGIVEARKLFANSLSLPL